MGDNSLDMSLEVGMTLHDRDALLEELWSRFEDVPMDPETECIEEEFANFPAGTNREEIWKWFDGRYSRGVHHLLYGYGGVDRTDEIAKLVYLNGLCDECESRACAYNDGDGTCKFALVRGRAPKITEEDGCVEGVVDPYWEEPK